MDLFHSLDDEGKRAASRIAEDIAESVELPGTLQEYVTSVFHEPKFISIDGCGDVWVWGLKPECTVMESGSIIWEVTDQGGIFDVFEVGHNLPPLDDILHGAKELPELEPFIDKDDIGVLRWYQNACHACLEFTPDLTYMDLIYLLVSRFSPDIKYWWNFPSFKELTLHE